MADVTGSRATEGKTIVKSRASLDKETFGPWAIVTGASAGIGKEFARQLAASGINLVLVARRLDALETIGHELAERFGVEYRALRVDLSPPS